MTTQDTIRARAFGVADESPTETLERFEGYSRDALQREIAELHLRLNDAHVRESDLRQGRAKDRTAYFVALLLVSLFATCMYQGRKDAIQANRIVGSK
jgi:hypothetical protein